MQTVIKKPNCTAIIGSQIMQTKDYQFFKLDIKNRPIDSQKVSNFVKMFKAGMFYMIEFPAIVDENYTIIDGQHRFEACKELGISFLFKQADTLNINNVVSVQSNAGWKPSDFIHTYIQQGKHDYVVLKRFMNRYNIAPSLAVLLLSADGRMVDREGGRMSPFYNGKFIVKDEANAHKVLKVVHEFKDLGFTAWRDRGFITAIRTILSIEEYDHKQMIHRMTNYGASLLKKQTTKNNYLRNLEELYNYRSQKTLRFI